MNKLKHDLWIPDEFCYLELQKLKKFVFFISELDLCSVLDKNKAFEIIELIENINNPETYKDWNLSLDIFDEEIRDGKERESGIFWRNWSVWFDKNSINIEAETKHTNEIGHYGVDYSYYGTIYLTKEIQCERIYMKNDLNDFFSDALNYKKYRLCSIML